MLISHENFVNLSNENFVTFECLTDAPTPPLIIIFYFFHSSPRTFLFLRSTPSANQANQAIFLHNQKVMTNLDILRTKRAFKVKLKAFFIIFEWISGAKTCLMRRLTLIYIHDKDSLLELHA